MAKNRKITKYRKKVNFNINIGTLIFVMIFIYITVYGVLRYTNASHVSVYEVQQGGLASSNVYRGLILRAEHVYPAEASGTVNYYVRENDRVGVGNQMYSIDESGRMAQWIQDLNAQENKLSKEDFSKIHSRISAFQSAYSSMDYAAAYRFKSELELSIIEDLNMGAIASLNEQNKDSGEGGSFRMFAAREPGVAAFYTDGFEAVTPETFTPDMLDGKNYNKLVFKSNVLLNAGDTAYKLITDENWSVVIEVDPALREAVSEGDSLEVRFLKDNTSAWATCQFVEKEGKTCLVLGFCNSMIRFASDRYLDIELLLNQVQGLKIPASAVVEKEFFTIPAEYVTKGGNDDADGFLRATNVGGAEFVAAKIYHMDETACYVDKSEFAQGDVILRPESTETFIVGPTLALGGVYNINQGYAIFREIKILYKNEEYCIVESATKYGLALYDHIALDGTSIGEGELVH